MAIDIRTRVELKNETQRERIKRGTAGRVALIGAFPSSKSKPFAAETFSEVVSHYGVKLNSQAVDWYNGVRAARRIFMEGITGMSGANSITCVNICRLRPSRFEDTGELYVSTNNDELIYDVDKQITTSASSSINEGDRYVPGDATLSEDIKLTFPKLEEALTGISDEDMDMLFIANDLWEILDTPITSKWTGALKIWKNGENVPTGQYTNSIVVRAKTVIETVKQSDGTTTTTSKEVYVPVLVRRDDGSIGFKCPYEDPTASPLVVRDLPQGEVDKKVYFKKREKSSGEYANDTLSKDYYFDPSVIDRIVIDEDYKTKKWDLDLEDIKGNVLYGITNSGKYIRNIGDIYDYILDFVDNEFTNHRPVNYIGAIKTRNGDTPEGLHNDIASLGLGSDMLKVFSDKYEVQEEDSDYKKELRTPTNADPYANIETWGALDIAKIFTRTTNELSTCGLFYQRGVINDVEVDEMELAAHMCGWICSININQDLTYQTIPALTDVEEEAYLGKNDAGTLLNQAGIQVIRPKSRLDNTWYVNNSIQPTGWHTNHVRSVTYLLKRLQFESGLGINNFTTNLEAYRAVLDATAKEVLDECDIIRSVEVGDIEVINNYHIYVPISIVLAGVVTLINVGVSMTLDDTGKIGTVLKTTTGYSVSI